MMALIPYGHGFGAFSTRTFDTPGGDLGLRTARPGTARGYSYVCDIVFAILFSFDLRQMACEVCDLKVKQEADHDFIN
jgi:hypothetical protein